ncbi:Ribonuclease Z [hydrothermal vent metagenome]|uniref:Ribonuclease Z n=1 Tax=hydrothermal vent metagenome TaxID=652676 RepID=A0A3B1A6P8_9ZZZZ
MQITLLGTSSGVPTKQRNVSATAFNLKNNKEWFLVDCGEATQQQVLRTKFSLLKLKAILITHMHGDHIHGLPGLLSSMQLSGRKNKLQIIGPKTLETYITSVFNFSQSYIDYPIEYLAVEELEDVYFGHSIKIKCHELSHRINSYAYQFIEIPSHIKLDVNKLRQDNIPEGETWGRVQRGERVTLKNGSVIMGEDYFLPLDSARSIIISGDNDNPDLLENACNNADVLVHEATFTQLILDKVGAASQHSSAQQIAKFAQRNSLKNLVLMHFSARYHYNRNQVSSIAEVEQEARKYFFGNLFLANDFDCFELSKAGILSKLN